MNFGSRPRLALTLPALASALLVLAQPAHAQNDADQAKGLERAQKAADAVFHWIKLNADKGANRQNPAPPPAPPAPAPAARKPAPVAAAPKPAPANTPAAVQAAATPAPPPVVAAAAPEPEPERAPVLLASAAPVPAPAAPLAAAARAVEPPPPPEEPAELPLKLLVKVEPTIPRQLQQQPVRGYAQVQFTVAPDGTVSKAQTIKASHARLGTAAVDAIKQWRFAPIGKPRDAAVEVAFNNTED
jgi:TonB family protein